ncbi:PepSY-associated TM helix domain-containing protein [Teredinibacter franksiae]|uniref:PepSY-associated TM helix domain-containing protein n=1 Tax=Teredinibacter franksiae TaxID=2761453 RepID=UPI001626221C|nr:PepSY domain-containing protein [Teredinibacter franksiae]
MNTNVKSLYRTLWRWHFYAGLYCIPFIILLSLTGMAYLFKPYYEHWQEQSLHGREILAERASPNEQIDAAIAVVGGGRFVSYRLPSADHEAVMIRIENGEHWLVYIDPYTLELLEIRRQNSGLMALVKKIHGELLAGKVGSILVELAACWAILLVVSGLYLWWPRERRLRGVLWPRFGSGKRLFWRDLHAVTGFWISAFVLFLLVSGLPWTSVWGGVFKDLRKLADAPPQQQSWQTGSGPSWQSPPVENYALNEAILSTVKNQKLASPVFLSVANEQSQLWKASSQTQNRPLRADLWVEASGHLSKRKSFSEKALLDRIVGVGIAAHEGQLFGVANLILGLLTGTGLIVLCVSGSVLWWRRRPRGELGAPPVLSGSKRLGLWVILFTLALLLPVLAASLIALLILEWGLLRRIEASRRWLGLV